MDDDSAWIQATLPVRFGGIGIRSAAQLAPIAFLASAAGCTDLVQEILPPRLQDALDPNIKLAMECWREGHEHPPPLPPNSHQQKAWDTPRVEVTYKSLLDSAVDNHNRARLLAVKCKETGAWLNALPVASLGLCMEDEAVRIAVGLRLGLSLCRPHQCVHCGSQVDRSAMHGLSCRFSKGRQSRHAGINNVIERSLDAAQIPSRLEPTGLYRTDGKRPDGASIVPWKGGRALVWDATCPDTLALSYEQISVREAGAVASEAERRKRLKYADLNST